MENLEVKSYFNKSNRNFLDDTLKLNSTISSALGKSINNNYNK